MARLLERKQRQIKRDAEKAKLAAEWTEKCKVWRNTIQEGKVKLAKDSELFNKSKNEQLSKIRKRKKTFSQAASQWRTLFEQGFSSIWAACRWPCSLEKTRDLFDQAEK